jgi:predicted  nucleic acid-binding Zn-ribbon protein
MLENRKIYESHLEAQLAQWHADIDVLKAKARRAEVGMKVRYDQTIEALQHKHEEAGQQLSGLRSASDEAWESVKASTEKFWNEVKSLFRDSERTH